MAKQSMGEKFISSAVRQVGRDLGKTVSNELFGDAHSTPVRHIKGDSAQEKKTSIWVWIIGAAVVGVVSALLEIF